MLTFKCQCLILQSPLDGSDKTTESIDPVQSVVLRGKTRVLDAAAVWRCIAHRTLRYALSSLRLRLRSPKVSSEPPKVIQ